MADLWIAISKRRRIATVIDEDALDVIAAVGAPSLYLHTANPGRGHIEKCYVMCEWWRDGERFRAYLHRLLCGLSPADGLTVDHKDGDGLNNRGKNLRVVTLAENAQNVPARTRMRNAVGVQSRHRGVSWDQRCNRWRAIVRLNRKNHYLGHFEDEDEAALAAKGFRQQHMPYALD